MGILLILCMDKFLHGPQCTLLQQVFGFRYIGSGFPVFPCFVFLVNITGLVGLAGIHETSQRTDFGENPDCLDYEGLGCAVVFIGF